MSKDLGRPGSLALIKQPISEKKNSKLKTSLRFKILLESRTNHGGEVA